MRCAALLLAACALLSCMPKTAPVRATSTIAVVSGFVNDRDEGQGLEPLPDAALAPSLAALGERNLRAKTVGRETVDVGFRMKRTTAQRLAVLASANDDAELLLLVETRTRFYSQLNGRYRWTVDAKISLAKRDARDEAATSEIDIPVFLDFDHQREPEALVAAGPRIADEVARLADEMITGLGATATLYPERRDSSDESAHSKGSDDLRARKSSLPLEWLLVAGPAGPAVKKTLPPPESIYFVMVDRFANGDKTNDGAVEIYDTQAFHGGDLQGVLDNLDHLQSLGISTVWLSPVFAMRTEKFHGYGAYHGYWTSDFGAIEPRFGDAALLTKLSDELHRRGMKLVLDVVLNHVGPDTPLTREHPDWFHGKGAITDWNDAEQLFTRDVFGLPDLAQEKEPVYEHLLSHSKRWIELVKPDGFRLDAARHIPPSFWARYTRDISKHAGPRFALYGEMYDGDAEGLSKTLQQSGFDAVFDFPLYFAMNDVFCKDQPPARLAATLTQDRLYPNAAKGLVTFLDNHDLPRLASACKKDTGRIVDALTFMLTARGTPSFTYGTESQMDGAKEPDNRADMVFASQADPVTIAMRELLELRRDHPVFVDGVSRPVVLTDDLFAYARILPDEAALVIVNRGASAASVAVPDDLAGSARDALTGDELAEGPIAVAPRSTRVVLLSSKSAQRARVRSWTYEPRVLPTGFAVRGVPALAAGETLCIAGSAPELGSWNPARAKALRRAKDGTFVGEIPLAAGVYEWKLVVRTKDGAPKWENGGNRSLLVERTGEVTAEWSGNQPALSRE